MWVKICANTNVEDALKAAEFGADAVGFVFAPSKRQVTAEQVRLISAELPPTVERVGVFGEIAPEEIAEAAIIANLTAIQMHGPVHFARMLRLDELLEGKIPIIPVVHWVIGEDEESARELEFRLMQLADYWKYRRVLVDTKVGKELGGTGVSFNWSKAAGVFASEPKEQIILAGGLRPDNVAEAIRVLKPWGVDVASGVESEPGRKDFAKLKAFIENARAAV